MIFALLRRACYAGVMVSCALAGGAFAGEFPDRPIRLVVPYSPGGGTDVVARGLAEGMSQKLGQPVVVENRPGANGIIGTRQVATAPADGYTYVLVVNSHLINPLIQKEMPYDTFKDFDGVTMVARSPLAFLVGSDMGIDSLDAFLAKAREPGARFSIGSSENMTRLVGDMLNYYEKLGMVSVMYPGGAPLMTSVAGGQTTIGTTSILTATPLKQAGKLRPLAITGTKRIDVWPDVPTMHELGKPQYDDVYTAFSLYAPAGTPRGILDKVQQTVREVVYGKKMHNALAAQAAEPVANSVEDFQAQVKRDFAFWKSLAEAVNLKPL